HSGALSTKKESRLWITSHSEPLSHRKRASIVGNVTFRPPLPPKEGDRRPSEGGQGWIPFTTAREPRRACSLETPARHPARDEHVRLRRAHRGSQWLPRDRAARRVVRAPDLANAHRSCLPLRGLRAQT